MREDKRVKPKEIHNCSYEERLLEEKERIIQAKISNATRYFIDYFLRAVLLGVTSFILYSSMKGEKEQLIISIIMLINAIAFFIRMIYKCHPTHKECKKYIRNEIELYSTKEYDEDIKKSLKLCFKIYTNNVFIYQIITVLIIVSIICVGLQKIF